MIIPDMRALQAGDPSNWEIAYHSLWPVAWGEAKRHLVTFAPADIEDVAIEAIQETAELVKLGNVGSFEGVKALAVVIARRRAIDRIRHGQAQRRARSVTENIENHTNEILCPQGNPASHAEASEIAALLLKLTQKLSPQHRKLLKAYYLDGLKQTEIAGKFAIKLGTVGVTLSRILESLRAELQKHPTLMKELKELLR